MHHLDAEKVRHIVPNITFRKAVDLYTKNEIKIIRLDQQHVDAEVFDSTWYSCKLTFNGEENHYSCSCNERMPCVHVTAVMLQSIRHIRENISPEDNQSSLKSNENLSEIIPPWKHYFQNAINALEIKRVTDFAKTWIPVCLLKFAQDKAVFSFRLLYIKRDGSPGRWQYWHAASAPKANIIRVPAMQNLIRYFEVNGQKSGDDYVVNLDGFSGYIFDLIRKIPIYQKVEHFLQFPVKNDAHLDTLVKFTLERSGKKVVFYPVIYQNGKKIPLDQSFSMVSTGPIYLYRNDHLYRIGNVENPDVIKPFIDGSQKSILFDVKALGEFWKTFFPKFPHREDIIIESSLQGETRKEITAKNLYLTEDNRHLYLRLTFIYGDVEVTSGTRATQIIDEQSGNRITIERDWPEEELAVNALLHSRLIRTRLAGEYTPRRGINHLDWLYDELPELSKAGFTCFGEEKLLSFKVNRNIPEVSLNIHSGINWFDVDVKIKFGEQDLSAKTFFKAIRDGRKYLQLGRGEFAKIPESWIEKWKTFAGLYKSENEQIKMPSAHIPLIEELNPYVDRFNTDKKYKQVKEKIENLTGVPEYKIPEKFNGTLRTYQIDGYRWLRFLYELGLGGILADDMGLGKTIQTLAFLSFVLTKKNQSKALIVMPASLIFNWAHEIKKFTPHLDYIEHTGLNRVHDLRAISNNTQIILTTYGIIRKDWLVFKELKFSVIVLDESQNIKNPLSRSFKAVSKLRSDFSLALSGTPVENTTIDMWSQMAFANPGMLGNLSWFRKNFALPIEKENNEEKSALLQKIIHPVVLRRTKELVEKDLPPKIEQIVYCNMTQEQFDFYHNIRNDYRNRLIREIDQNGLEKSKLRVVEYLTRLRQAANHPRLLNTEMDISSGKMNTLMNLISDITADRYKVLIFSQFVKMLGFVRQELVKNSIRFSYLDGSTRNRESVVSDFQLDNDIQVFLISIKAGGTGLNLTAAEYVIQVDPWWNPAVENQATDRAHRIGQDKKVMVHKLITHGSVEEKILQLQERKKSITQNILSADSSLVRKLSKADIMEIFENEPERI